MARDVVVIFKGGANCRSLNKEILGAVFDIEEIYASYNIALVITSGNDGKHKVGSKHYSNDAVDCRTHNIPQHLRAEVYQKITARLGAKFDVLHEYKGTPNEHYHVEYDPK